MSMLRAAPALLCSRPLVVTGGAGFIGCNLAARLAREGNHVIVFDSLARTGVEENLDWLRREQPQRISFVRADVRDRDAVGEVIGSCASVFHLAAQVAVTSSMIDSRHDLEVNVEGTFNVLDAARRARHRPSVIVASTNKVYGNMCDVAIELRDGRYRPVDEKTALHGVGESQSLSFQTPYGCSKGAADQYAIEWARTQGVQTVVLRMSCIYGPRQHGTTDQGWVAHFAASVLSGRPITIFGDGCQVRDVLHVDNAVEAYVGAWQRIDSVAGKAFNLGGGPANAVSVASVAALLARLAGTQPDLHFAEWRPGDQRWFVSDTRAVASALDLPTPLPWRQGIAHLYSYMADRARGETAGKTAKVAKRSRHHVQEAS